MMKGRISKAVSVPVETVAVTYATLLILFGSALLALALSPAAHAQTPSKAQSFDWLAPKSSGFVLDASVYNPNKALLPSIGELVSSIKANTQDAVTPAETVEGPKLAYARRSFAQPANDGAPLQIFVPFAEHNFLNHVETRTDAFAFGHDSRTGF